MKTYVNKIKIELSLKLTGYYLELLTPETKKLLETTKSKITKNENGEKVEMNEVALIEMNEVALIHCSIVNNDYQQG